VRSGPRCGVARHHAWCRVGRVDLEVVRERRPDLDIPDGTPIGEGLDFRSDDGVAQIEVAVLEQLLREAGWTPLSSNGELIESAAVRRG
jgi:hypothetical protein